MSKPTNAARRKYVAVGEHLFKWPLRGDDVVTAWRAARKRKGVNKLAGVIYAECLRQGRVLSAKSAASACRASLPDAQRAITALERAQLIPSREAIAR